MGVDGGIFLVDGVGWGVNVGEWGRLLTLV